MSAHRVLQDLALANYENTDPGNAANILVDRDMLYVPLATTAAETRTLPVPVKAGILVVLGMVVDGGDCVVTVAGGYDPAGNTAITFNDAGDWVMLLSVLTAAGTYRWRVLQGQGVLGPALGVVSDSSAAAGAGTATLVFKADDASTPTLTQNGWLAVKIGAATKYVPYFSAMH